MLSSETIVMFFGGIFVGLGVVFLLVIGAVLGAWASLHGLGFAIDKICAYVLGRNSFGAYHRKIKGARWDKYANAYMDTAGESYDDFQN